MMLRSIFICLGFLTMLGCSDDTVLQLVKEQDTSILEEKLNNLRPFSDISVSGSGVAIIFYSQKTAPGQNGYFNDAEAKDGFFIVDAGSKDYYNLDLLKSYSVSSVAGSQTSIKLSF